MYASCGAAPVSNGSPAVTENGDRGVEKRAGSRRAGSESVEGSGVGEKVAEASSNEASVSNKDGDADVSENGIDIRSGPEATSSNGGGSTSTTQGRKQSLPAVQTPATPPRERESVYYRRAGAGNAGSGGSADGGEFSLGLPPIQKSGGAGVMVGTGEHRKSGYGMSVAPPFTPTGKQIPLYVGGTGNGNGSGNEEARSPYGGSTTAHKTGTSGGTARQNAGSGRARRDDGKGERDDSGGDVEGNGGSFSDGDEV